MHNEDLPHMNPAASLVIKLFGGLSLSYLDKTLPLSHPQAQRLLIYLLLHPAGPRRRLDLVGRLWPDQEAARARRTLSEALYRLRQTLGEQWIAADKERISLANTSLMEVDIWQFKTAASSKDIDQWQQAIALYNGDLLPEIDYDWTLLARESCREIQLRLLAELAWHEEGNRNTTAAITYYQRLFKQSPLREDAARGLMRCLAKTGRQSEAQIIYDNLSKALHDGLQIAPTGATTRLARQIREDEALFATVNTDELPLLGRRRERQQLLALLNESELGVGNLAVLFGETGMGKSRLLEHLADSARWRGWHIYHHKAEELLPSTPFSPFLTALLDGFSGARQGLLGELVNSYTLEIISHLTPHLNGAPAKQLPEIINYSEAQLLNAVLTFALEIAAAGPTLILLDDVQWAHPLFWQLIDMLLPQLEAQSIFVVISARPETLTEHESSHLLRQWEASGAWLFNLTPLQQSELKQLADIYGRAVTEPEVAELWRRSAGNPLLAISWLQQPAGSSLNDDTDLEQLLLARLEPLSPAAQLALQAASVLGFRFQFDQWQQLFRTFPVSELPHVLIELEAPRLIRSDIESYRFDHDSLRTAVYQQIPTERRQRLHRHVLDILPEESTSVNILVYHARQSGDEAIFAQYAARAGLEASQQFQYDRAVELLTIALEHDEPIATEKRFELLQARALANGVLAERELQRTDLIGLESLASNSQNVSQLIIARRQMALFLASIGEISEATELAREGLALAKAAQMNEQIAELQTELARILRISSDFGEAESLLLEARRYHQTIADQSGYAFTTDKLGGLAWATGRFSDAINLHQQAADIFSGAGNQYRAAMALNNLGSAHWSNGDYDAARAALQQAWQINKTIGHRRGEADNLDNIGGLYWVEADYDAAIEYYQQALEIRRAIDDRWGIAISSGNLGGTYRLQERYDLALVALDEALKINRAMSRQLGIGYNQINRGYTLLGLQDYDAAHDAFSESAQIWQSLARIGQIIESDCGWLHLALAEQNSVALKSAITKVQAHLNDAVQPMQLAQLNYALHLGYLAGDDVIMAAKSLGSAYLAVEAACQSLSPAHQKRLRQNHAICRNILASRTIFAKQKAARLVYQDTPQSGPRESENYADIVWTIAAPEDNLIAGKAERRHYILQRLIREAQEHKTRPTINDLAAALDVSRRTILRDLKELSLNL